MIADIFITTKGRPALLRKSLQSFKECTPRDQYRLTVVHDGVDCDTKEVLLFESAIIDSVISHNLNRGLGPSINQALNHIDALKKWDGPASAPPLTVYLQDDILYTEGWLERLSRSYLQLKGPLKLGFASGIECPEHAIDKDLGNGMITKKWIRATSMMATHDYWMSMWPISKIDPETGKERGRPHDGLGSSVDWWFIRNHQNSVCKTGRTNLVIPGLLQHAGYQESTWLKRPLPETDHDRMIIDGTEFTCDDCGATQNSEDLIIIGDHHGGKKIVCTDRDYCHRRSSG